MKLHIYQERNRRNSNSGALISTCVAKIVVNITNTFGTSKTDGCENVVNHTMKSTKVTNIVTGKAIASPGVKAANHLSSVVIEAVCFICGELHDTTKSGDL